MVQQKSFNDLSEEFECPSHTQQSVRNIATAEYHLAQIRAHLNNESTSKGINHESSNAKQIGIDL